MPDPFEALRSPIEPVAPNPEFSSRLRARLERAFTLPKGVTVSDLEVIDQEVSSGTTPQEVEEVRRAVGHATISPYIAIAGASEAIAWYGSAFGARLRSEPIMMGDGRVGHAEIEIGGSLVMLADEFPEIGFTAPTSDHKSGVTLHLGVADVDAVIASAVASGATLDRPATDFEYGRNGAITDPFGHRWLVHSDSTTSDSEAEREGAAAFRHGDIGYVSLQVRDTSAAATFFSNALGWTYEPASGPQGRRVAGFSRIHHGIWGDQEWPTLFCCYAVSDIGESIERVRAAGGSAGEPHQEPYGLISDCFDDQGVAFALFEPPGGTTNDPPAGDRGVNGEGAGDLAYITMEVIDSQKARDFYGSVLGWAFDEGRIEDGWQLREANVMVGMSGGHSAATTLPMYRVDDVGAAVAAVRSAGGTATDPETYPYGVTSDCVDDQGTRFYLGQLS